MSTESVIKLKLKKVLRYFKTIPFLFLFLTGSGIAFAQYDTLVFQPVDNPILQQYDIRTISAGKDGKLFLCTGNGLISFDGSDIHVYSHDENDRETLSGDNL